MKIYRLIGFDNYNNDDDINFDYFKMTNEYKIDDQFINKFNKKITKHNKKIILFGGVVIDNRIDILSHYDDYGVEKKTDDYGTYEEFKISDLSKSKKRVEFLEEYKKTCGNNYTPAILPQVEEIIVFGDIHGDLKMAKDLLITSGVAKEKKGKLKWIGGKKYVVQVGDQVDRCRPVTSVDGRLLSCDNKDATLNDENSDVEILKLFTDLDEQAIKVGGRVISLLGNHELMNSSGDLNYVSYLGLKGFENYKDPVTGEIFESGHHGRKHAFAPGNEYGKFLACSRVPAIIIGTNLFVHAGFIDSILKFIGIEGAKDIESINMAIRKWLMGTLPYEHVEKIVKGSKQSIFWTRELGNIPGKIVNGMENPLCAKNLNNVLRHIRVEDRHTNYGNIERKKPKDLSVVIGHTPQSFTHTDDINATCGGLVWRVDNGGSAAFHNYDNMFLTTGKVSHARRLQYLQIINDNIYNVCDKDKCVLSVTK